MNDYFNSAEMYDAIFKPKDGELLFYSKYIKSGFSVLELGCGTGNITIELMKETKAMSFTCVDISKNMLTVLNAKYEEAKEMYSHLKKKKFRILEIPMAEFESDDKYDLIIFPGESIQSNEKKDIPNIIEKFLRMLSNKGSMIISTFNLNAITPEGCKEKLRGMYKYQDNLLVATDSIEILNNDRLKYTTEIKRYDKYGNFKEVIFDEFDICMIDDEYWKEIIDKKGYRIEKWQPCFSGKPIKSDYYSVIVMRKCI
jgi:ubiquinone/menaquinone biosynthesis C-methylase UbiE